MDDIATPTRLTWADRARGLCMMAILLFHTEKYYAGEEIIPYAFYVNNVLITFFFISGYLFNNPEKAFSMRHKLLSVLRGIILPYFIFTAVIALPKALVHDDTTLIDTYTDVLTGHASWFVAALAVAEVVFAPLVNKWGGRMMILGVWCVLPYLIMAIAYHLLDNDRWSATNFWCWHNALLMMPFIFTGFVFRRHKEWMHLIQRPSTILLLVIIEAVIKCTVWKQSLLLTCQPIHVDSFILFFADGIIGSLIIISICHHLPRLRWMEWTGKHSLIYYFICGGVPLLVTRCLAVCGYPYHNNYYMVIVAFMLVYVISTILSFFILLIFQKKKIKI